MSKVRFYKSTSGNLVAKVKLVPFSRDFFRDEHIYTEVVGYDTRRHRYNWHVDGSFEDAIEWLRKEYGYGWTRDKYAK